MIDFRWSRRPEDLRSPALVFAFTGWNDAGEASSMALTAIERSLSAVPVADIDTDELLDYQASRPLIDLDEPGTHEVLWPELALLEARVPGAPRDLLLLRGPEPSYRWRGFCDLIAREATALGVTRVIGLGSLLAAVPHTRPVTLTGIATPPDLVEGLPFRAPGYRGPTGIVGALHSAAADAGIEAVSLWAPVPHYLGGAPNPAGALAIVRGLERVSGVAISAGRLEDAAAEHERQISAAVEHDPAARALVERLEQAAEEEGEGQLGPGTLPSGDTLASEVEQFLRQREADPGS